MDLGSIGTDALFKIGDRTITVGSFLTVLLLVVLAFVLLRFVRSAVYRRVKGDEEQRSRLLSGYLLVQYAIWVIVALSGLEILGVNITFLLAGSAALLVGLGLGIQQTFNDIVSGIIILLEGTIRVGDVLEVEGLVGRVTQINLRTSTVYSRDGMNVIVPNHRFINENVVNWSHNALETRFRLSVGVRYGSDEELVREILLECARKHPMVISDDHGHPVMCRLIDFGDSAIIFEVLFWSRNIFFIEQTKSEIRFAIVKMFRDKGVVIPFPQRDVHIIPQEPRS